MHTCNVYVVKKIGEITLKKILLRFLNQVGEIKTNITTKKILKILKKTTGIDFNTTGGFAEKWIFNKGVPEMKVGFFF